MSILKLPTYQLTERSFAWVYFLLTLPANISLLDLLNHKVGAREVIGLTATFALCHLATYVEKSVTLTENRMLLTNFSIFGVYISSKKTDISSAAWVRARGIGSRPTVLVIEIGTNGYETTELYKLGCQTGKGVPEANEWCERIASYLGLPNKGYKGEG